MRSQSPATAAQSNITLFQYHVTVCAARYRTKAWLFRHFNASHWYQKLLLALNALTQWFSTLGSWAILEGSRVELLSAQLYYISFIRVLDGMGFVGLWWDAVQKKLENHCSSGSSLFEQPVLVNSWTSRPGKLTSKLKLTSDILVPEKRKCWIAL